MSYVFGVVVVHRQLFQDDGSFVLEFDGINQRRGEHIGDHIDGQRKRPVLYSRVVGGVLLAGGSI